MQDLLKIPFYVNLYIILSEPDCRHVISDVIPNMVLGWR